jgi:hypothetical protein
LNSVPYLLMKLSRTLDGFRSCTHDCWCRGSYAIQSSRSVPKLRRGTILFKVFVSFCSCTSPEDIFCCLSKSTAFAGVPHPEEVIAWTSVPLHDSASASYHTMRALPLFHLPIVLESDVRFPLLGDASLKCYLHQTACKPGGCPSSSCH